MPKRSDKRRVDCDKLPEETKANNDNGNFPGLRRQERDSGGSKAAPGVTDLVVTMILMMALYMQTCFRIYKPALDVQVNVCSSLSSLLSQNQPRT